MPCCKKFAEKINLYLKQIGQNTSEKAALTKKNKARFFLVKETLQHTVTLNNCGRVEKTISTPLK